ncbi:hypothetical protein BJV78DRAFT_1202445 [Lactifluus subvellereus]|nr:hypothetical protein BJV78DRAFT_1202445 [Lactifluus subvellereus]
MIMNTKRGKLVMPAGILLELCSLQIFSVPTRRFHGVRVNTSHSHRYITSDRRSLTSHWPVLRLLVANKHSSIFEVMNSRAAANLANSLLAVANRQS